MPLTGEHTPTSKAGVAILTGIATCAGTISALDRGCQPFRLHETKPEVRQACLLIAFEAGDLHLRRLPSLKLGHHLDPPHQIWQSLTLVMRAYNLPNPEQTPQLCMLSNRGSCDAGVSGCPGSRIERTRAPE
jgi:hypothetical protein